MFTGRLSTRPVRYVAFRAGIQGTTLVKLTQSLLSPAVAVASASSMGSGIELATGGPDRGKAMTPQASVTGAEAP